MPPNPDPPADALPWGPGAVGRHVPKFKKVPTDNAAQGAGATGPPEKRSWLTDELVLALVVVLIALMLLSLMMRVRRWLRMRRRGRYLSEVRGIEETGLVGEHGIGEQGEEGGEEKGERS
ncbi:MAG: hypothetical protein M1822_001299 [Bathelium mastoideum]|nr:MAG: hypothetical protein M1822_001299 [Bathelium mastoideum]